MTSRADKAVFAVVLVTILLSVGMSCLLAYAAPPTPQLTIPCQVVRVIDGDTVEVEVRTRFSVRLLDCWAPEKHETGVAGEKARGVKSETALRDAIDGKAGVVSIPLPPDAETPLTSILTLGRVLGSVHVEGVGDVATVQRKAGHAFATKDELTAALKRGGK